ncbi:MAG: hypothetical protein M3O70_27640, partial [Actinomycetota bacterium]|nr:hypothetical protein [Actinomycetota bacterium]
WPPSGPLRSPKNFPPSSLDREPPRPRTGAQAAAGSPAARTDGASSTENVEVRATRDGSAAPRPDPDPAAAVRRPRTADLPRLR